MVIEVIAVAKLAAPWLIAAGAAYGGVRQALNGTRERITKLETKVDDTGQRLVRVETTIEFIADHYRN